LPCLVFRVRLGLSSGEAAGVPGVPALTRVRFGALRTLSPLLWPCRKHPAPAAAGRCPSPPPPCGGLRRVQALLLQKVQVPQTVSANPPLPPTVALGTHGCPTEQREGRMSLSHSLLVLWGVTRAPEPLSHSAAPSPTHPLWPPLLFFSFFFCGMPVLRLLPECSGANIYCGDACGCNSCRTRRCGRTSLTCRPRASHSSPQPHRLPTQNHRTDPRMGYCREAVSTGFQPAARPCYAIPGAIAGLPAPGSQRSPAAASAWSGISLSCARLMSHVAQRSGDVPWLCRGAVPWPCPAPPEAASGAPGEGAGAGATAQLRRGH